MIETSRSQEISLAAVARALSERRLEEYRRRPDDPPAVVLARYRWNIALCTSLYPALGLLEVALRNSLHRSITELYSTPTWYDPAPAVLTAREQDAVKKAKDQLRKQRKPQESDRLVAELTFGFWTSLLSRDYERKLWPRLLVRAFPHMPRRDRTRARVADRLHPIRWLRNQISHHKLIYALPNPTKTYHDILDTISWLEPELRRLLPVGEGFPDIFARGPEVYKVGGT